MQHPDPHPDPLGAPTTVLPDSLLPGTWSAPPADPADRSWPTQQWPAQPSPQQWPDQPAADQPWPDQAAAGRVEVDRRGRHQAPLTGPGGVPLSFTDQLLEPVVGWWQGLRRAAVARDRRLLIGAVVLLPTLAVFGVVALLPGPPSAAPTAAVAPSPSASPSADPAATAAKPATVGQLTALTSDRAAALMGPAGLSLPGQPDQAWTFRDRSGLNLLVATIEPTGVQDVTLRVALFGGVDGTPTALSRLADAGLPGCAPAGNPDNGKRKNEKRKKRDRSGQGSGNQDRPPPPPVPAPDPTPVAAAGFTIDSVTLADRDGDGIGEVTVGWSSSCGDPATVASRAELATLTGNRSFLLQGQGMIGGGAVTSPATPQPAASSWPAGSLEAAQALFRRLYF